MDLHMGNNRKASSDSNPNSHILEVSMSTFCNYSVFLLFPFQKCFQFMKISRYCTGVVEQIWVFKIGSPSETSSLLVFNSFCTIQNRLSDAYHAPIFVRLCFPKNALYCFLARILSEIVKIRPIDVFLFSRLIS